MRLLVVLAHPAPESFSHALARTVTDAARAAGHDVHLIDLCADGFDPVLSAGERRQYHAPDRLSPDLRPHVDALRQAEGLILVYPTWWNAPPAILKGWLDRVWRPGVAFADPAPGQALRPGLPGLRLIGVVTTLGSPWWVWTLLLGAPGRRMILRGLRVCTAPRTRTLWLALHDIDRQDSAARARFLARVQARIAALPR
jgi:putative NADPH-quinone reductase